MCNKIQELSQKHRCSECCGRCSNIEAACKELSEWKEKQIMSVLKKWTNLDQWQYDKIRQAMKEE